MSDFSFLGKKRNLILEREGLGDSDFFKIYFIYKEREIVYLSFKGELPLTCATEMLFKVIDHLLHFVAISTTDCADFLKG